MAVITSASWMLDKGAAHAGDWIMQIRHFQQALDWGVSPIPQESIRRDWHGAPCQPPAEYALVQDPSHLWLIAGHGLPANAHPHAGNGQFQEGLWRHDVAELFIARPDRQGYLEFNLSPTGAWWFARFSAPRQLAEAGKRPEVVTHAGERPNAGWTAALGIPLDYLKSSIQWGDGSAINVAFILGSPRQKFLSAVDLGAGDPDFHRPHAYAELGVI